MTARETLIAIAIKNKGDWNKIYDDIQSRNIKGLENIDTKSQSCITIIDENYPQSLKNIYRPPFVLFYSGDISLLNTAPVAVLGSRENTAGDISRTIKIVNILNKNSKTVVTTNTKGVNEIALKTAQKTILVLDCGLNLCQEKADLLLTEYPENTPKTQDNCINRHRIVSAIAEKLAFIKLKSHSGLLITVNFALSIDRDIYCVPDLENDDSPCNKLITEGANLLISGTELL